MPEAETNPCDLCRNVYDNFGPELPCHHRLCSRCYDVCREGRNARAQNQNLTSLSLSISLPHEWLRTDGGIRYAPVIRTFNGEEYVDIILPERNEVEPGRDALDIEQNAKEDNDIGCPLCMKLFFDINDSDFVRQIKILKRADIVGRAIVGLQCQNECEHENLNIRVKCYCFDCKLFLCEECERNHISLNKDAVGFDIDTPTTKFELTERPPMDRHRIFQLHEIVGKSADPQLSEPQNENLKNGEECENHLRHPSPLLVPGTGFHANHPHVLSSVRDKYERAEMDRVKLMCLCRKYKKEIDDLERMRENKTMEFCSALQTIEEFFSNIHDRISDIERDFKNEVQMRKNICMLDFERQKEKLNDSKLLAEMFGKAFGVILARGNDNTADTELLEQNRCDMLQQFLYANKDEYRALKAPKHGLFKRKGIAGQLIFSPRSDIDRLIKRETFGNLIEVINNETVNILAMSVRLNGLLESSERFSLRSGKLGH